MRKLGRRAVAPHDRLRGIENGGESLVKGFSTGSDERLAP